MANNRLYIVDTKTNEHLCIAKDFGEGWGLGNVDLLKKFLSETYEGDQSNLIIGTENDQDFWKEYIENGINMNTTNKWEYA